MRTVKRVIISGATGAIGTALIESLIRNDIEVLVLCREGSVRNNAIPKHPLVKTLGISLDEYSLYQPDADEAYDAFYHFAWVGTTGAARNDAVLQNCNIKYSLDAVSLAKRFGCRLFIGAGSQAEYGRYEGNLTPSTPVCPENGYGIAKLCAGQLTRLLARQFGMEHVWVRVLSVYGPNDGAQTMISSTIVKLKNREKMQLTKGEQLWDYLYSADAAEAFRLLGEKGVDGKTYVLGSGKALPLRAYIEVIGKSLNAENLLEFGAVPYAEKQVMHLCADISELVKDTGWKPKTEFREGIEKLLSVK